MRIFLGAKRLLTGSRRDLSPEEVSVYAGQGLEREEQPRLAVRPVEVGGLLGKDAGSRFFTEL